MDRLDVTPGVEAANVSLSEEFAIGINVQLRATDAQSLWHAELSSSWALESIFGKSSRHLARRAECLEPPSGPATGMEPRRPRRLELLGMQQLLASSWTLDLPMLVRARAYAYG